MILSLLERRNKSPLDDFWYKPIWYFGGEGAGSSISPQKAMTLSAWYAAISLVAGTIGSIPLRLYRRDDQGNAVPVPGDPRDQLVHRMPTPWHTALEWREMAQGHLMARGNTYNRIIRDATGRAIQLEPLRPDKVQVETKGGELVYIHKRKSGDRELAMEDVLHLRGFGSDGITGYSVVALARQTLEYGLGLEKHGAELMQNKARPGGILRTDQVLKKETRDALRAAWDQSYTAEGIGKTAVLDAGLNWQSVGFSAEDAQFIESRSFQITEIARWTNIPPHFLKDLSRATYSNIEQQSLEFVIHTIRPWAERWEQRLDVALLEPEERSDLFFKFSLEGLLRGDAASRAAFYTSLFQLGSISPNEIRKLEDLPTIEGGDQRFVQLNMVPLDQAADPFGSMDNATERALAHGEKRLIELEEPKAPAVIRSALELEERSLTARRRLMDTYERLIGNQATRIVNREVNDLRRLLDAVEDGDTDEFLRRLAIFEEGLPPAVRSIFGPVLAGYIDLIGAEAADEVQLEELDEERLGAFRDSYVDGFVRGHVTETTGRIRDTMATESGDPFGNVRKMLDRWEESRAAEIGLREAVTAAGAAATTVYQFAGRGARWRTTGRENCPYCDLLDGRSVGPGEKFLQAGETLEPEGDHEPMTINRAVGHPQAHRGCDCSITAG